MICIAKPKVISIGSVRPSPRKPSETIFSITMETATRARLESGPLRATKAISVRGLCMRYGFTGTGLAQPRAGKPAIMQRAGSTTVPTGSICGSGLKDSRPER